MRLAYVAADRDLYVQDDTAEPRLLVGTGDVTQAQISTDGTRIVYVRDPEGLPPELWVIHADGTNARRILGRPAVEALNPELLTQADDYGFMVYWIPYHHELIVEVRATTDEGWGWESSGVQRLDVDSLALNPFPGPWESPFSPDGEWFAMPEDDSLTLIRTDGTEEHHRLLEGYRFIGISSYSILPPLAWVPGGVRVIFPPLNLAEEFDPREPPFEIWEVPLDGEPVLLGTITDEFEPFILTIYLAPGGEHFAQWDGRDRWHLTQVGGGTYRMGSEPLSLVWWNPVSTHFVHQAQSLYLSDICGSTTTFDQALGQSSVWLQVRWMDAARALVVARRHDAEGRPVGIDAYLTSAADNSITLLGETWLSADAALVP